MSATITPETAVYCYRCRSHLVGFGPEDDCPTCGHPERGTVRAYCERHRASIYVRAELDDGKWGTVALSELPPVLEERMVAGFVARGFIPSRVVEP